jgi:hypothetical protein
VSFYTSSITQPKLSDDIEKVMRNRGTGAGGYKTNASGKPFEDAVRMVPNGQTYNEEFTYFEQNAFNIHMKDLYKGTPGSKAFRPDGAYVSGDRRRVFILECKNQSCAGSVDEKLLTGPTKVELYRNKYPGVEIHFAFVLREAWFNKVAYVEWLDILKKHGIAILWVKDVKVSLECYDFDSTQLDAWLKQ